MTILALALLLQDPIEYNREVEGVLSAAEPTLEGGQHYYAYVFQGAAGDAITIELESTEFDPWLMLCDANRQIIAYNDDIEQGNRNCRVQFALTQTGAHHIYVTSFGAGETGAFLLRFIGPGGAPAAPGMIAYGGRIDDRLTAQDPVMQDGRHWRRFDFDGRRGDAVTIRLSSDDFDTYLSLSDPQNTTLATNDDTDGTNSVIQHTLPADGRYIVYATSYAAGAGGAFTLALEGPSTPTTTPAAIAYGGSINDQLTTLDGTFDGGQYWRAYPFDGRAGDPVRITMTSTEFDPYLALYDSQNQTLATNDDADGANSRIEFTLPADGRYVIIATSYRAGATGAFTLALQGPSAPPTTGASLTYGGAIDAALTDIDPIDNNGKYYREYTFDGRRGEAITIAMNSAEFDTWLALSDAQGNQLAFNDDADGTNSRIAFTLPADARYTITVSSFRPGATGSFHLTLTGPTTTPPVVNPPTTNTTSLTFGAPFPGALSPADPATHSGAYYHDVPFDGLAGQTVEASVTAAFPVSVAIVGPDGSAIHTGAGPVSAYLPSNGRHAVRVSAREPGVTGEFSVTLTLRSSENEGRWLRYGQEATGRAPDVFRLGASAGDVARIRVTASSGRPAVRVLSPEGRQVAAFADAETECTLEREGAYRIEVGGSGDFTIRLSYGGGIMTAPIDTSDMPVLGESQGQVTRAQGGSVRLEDGMTLSIPAGALPQDRAVTVRRLQTGMEDQFVIFGEVDLGDEPLARPATVTVNAPAIPPEYADIPHEWQAFRFEGDRMIRLPSTHDETRGTLTLESREYSPFAWFLVLFLADLIVYGNGTIPDNVPAFYNIVARNPVAPLAVPYYNQNMTMWCWATASQMLMSAYGVYDTENWDLAAQQGLGFRNGMWLTAHAFGSFESLFRQRGLELIYSRIPWRNSLMLSLNVVWHLRQGRPVLLDMNSVAHAVVAVGFDNAAVYIHDPSGSLIEYAMPDRANTWESQSRLAAVPIPWPQFMRACEAGNGNVWSAAVANRRLTGNRVSIQLHPGCFKYSHPGPQPHPNQCVASRFGWMGRREPGVDLCDSCAAGQDRAGHAHPYPNYPSNSSEYFLQLHMSVAGPQPTGVEITATLGGQDIMAPFTTTVPTELVEPYGVNTVYDLTGSRFVRLLQTPLQPGQHPLVITARVGGNVVDRITFPVTVGPSQVTGLRPDVRGEETVLVWDRVPESICEYQVYRIHGSATAAPEFLQQVAALEYRLPRRNFDDPPDWYFVHAYHTDTGLMGPASNLYCTGTPPEIEITAPHSGDTVTDNVVTVTGRVRGTQNGQPGGQPIDQIMVFSGDTPYPTTVSNEQFEQRVRVRPGENVITVRAINAAGRTERTVTIEAEIEQNILTIEMTWFGNGNDVDLHVTDPGGRVTGYADPISPGGRVDGRRLDIDDTSGPGTETYTITAEVYGEYQVRINYYRGPPGQSVLVRWTTHEGTPQEQTGQRNVSLGEEDHNSGAAGSNVTFPITVPPRQ